MLTILRPTIRSTEYSFDEEATLLIFNKFRIQYTCKYYNELRNSSLRFEIQVTNDEKWRPMVRSIVCHPGANVHKHIMALKYWKWLKVLHIYRHIRINIHDIFNIRVTWGNSSNCATHRLLMRTAFARLDVTSLYVDYYCRTERTSSGRHIEVSRQRHVPCGNISNHFFSMSKIFFSLFQLAVNKNTND